MQEVDKLSIIITCYNDIEYIELAINSAIAQTYDNKEIIVIDDGSETQTKKKLAALQTDIDILITQENQGTSIARNMAISRATGDYVLILDSDDTFDPSFSVKAIEVLKNKKEVKAVNCYANWFKNSGSSRIYKPKGGAVENFLNNNAGIGNAMLRKVEIDEVGGYDEAMVNGYEDWEFFLRLLKNGGELYVIPEILFNYRNRENSRNKKATQKKYELWEYIFTKHQDLYKENFLPFIQEFLRNYQKNEMFKQQIIDSLDYSLGNKILKPIRLLGWLKK